MGKRLSVLIAGCGDVGSRLGLQLGRDGWRVYGLRRNAAELPVPILPVKGDLTDPTCPRCWPNGGLDYLVYAASATEHDEAGYRQAYVEGLRNVLRWLRQHEQQPRRLLFVSSTGVYAQRDGEWIDEDSPLSITQQANEKAEELYAWVADQTVDEIRDLATAFRIPNARVANGANVEKLDHYMTRQSFVVNPRDGFTQPAPPYRTTPAMLRPPEPAPRLGEHTDLYRSRNSIPGRDLARRYCQECYSVVGQPGSELLRRSAAAT